MKEKLKNDEPVWASTAGARCSCRNLVPPLPGFALAFFCSFLLFFPPIACWVCALGRGRDPNISGSVLRFRYAALLQSIIVDRTVYVLCAINWPTGRFCRIPKPIRMRTRLVAKETALGCWAEGVLGWGGVLGSGVCWGLTDGLWKRPFPNGGREFALNLK